MQRKKGISLIVLVITIIVMIILAAAIILSLNNAGIIGNANQAVFKQNIKNYLSELDLYYMDALVENPYANTKNIKATATTSPSITDLIPSMSEEDKTKFRVAGGELIYIGANRSEYEWCRELGIKIDSTNLSEEEYNALYAEEIAYAESIRDEGDAEFGPGYIIKRGTVLETDTIVVPYGTTALGYEAFSNYINLKQVVLPSSVQTINGYAFENCSSITNIQLPSGVAWIGEDAFYKCTGLESIDLPEALTWITMEGFYGCESLINITIPKNVTHIGWDVFTKCTNLQNIYVEEGNTKYSSINGVLYNVDQTSLIAVPGARQGIFNIPNTVIEIADKAFSWCANITKIDIPTSVTTIGTNAFSNCKSLTSLDIPNSVTSYDYTAHVACTNLENVKFLANITWVGGFSNCTKLKNIKISDSVTMIQGSGFKNCSSLEKIVIPAKVKTINALAFDNCTKLKEIYIESTELTTVVDNALTTIAEGSVIYVRSAEVANLLSGKYDTSKTTISTNYNW